MTHIYSRWKSAKVPKNGLWQAGAVTKSKKLSHHRHHHLSLFTLRYFDLRHKLDFQLSTLARLSYKFPHLAQGLHSV